MIRDFRLYPLATRRIAINLDDGVLVNYNKFGKAVKTAPGFQAEEADRRQRMTNPSFQAGDCDKEQKV